MPGRASKLMEGQKRDPDERGGQGVFLTALYDVYDEWADRFPLACRKGCSSCCTSSVSMTSLEGGYILDFLRQENRVEELPRLLAETGPPQSRPASTTNEFAAACLAGRDTGEDAAGWDFAPCMFLADGACTIYPARPFGCRSFGSLVPCGAGTAAEMAPIHLAVNTVFTQVVEGADSFGGFWGNMMDILECLAAGSSAAREKHLLPARPVPGFLLGGREAKLVGGLLAQLRQACTSRGIGSDLIDNCMLME